MTQINWSRVFLGALVWFGAYNVLTGAAWFAFLRRVGDPSFHPLLAAPGTPPVARIVSLLLMTLAMGILAMWLYAAIRPRYSASRLPFAYVGIALWLFWGLLPNWPAPDIFSSAVAAELASKLVVLVVSTAAGASLYRERVVRDLSASA